MPRGLPAAYPCTGSLLITCFCSTSVNHKLQCWAFRKKWITYKARTLPAAGRDMTRSLYIL